MTAPTSTAPALRSALATHLPDVVRNPNGTARLVVLDLDGTLAGRGLAVLGSDAAAVERSVVKGIPVVIATGRPMASAARVARSVLAQYVIALNGAVLARADGTVVYAHEGFPPATVTALVNAASRNSVSLTLDDVSTRVAPLGFDDAIRARADEDGLPLIVGSVDHLASAPLRAQYIGPPEAITAVRRALAGTNTYASGGRDHLGDCLEVVPATVSKSGTLRRLRLITVGEHLGEVLAVGDGENDVDLFRSAETSVAVGSHPNSKLLAVATYALSRGPSEGAVGTVLRGLIEGDASALAQLTPLRASVH